MKVTELFRQLSFGELSNLALAQEGSGSILEEKIPHIVMHTNEALLRVFSRFILRENFLLLEQVGHLTSYELTAKYAELNEDSDEPYKYIKDGLYDAFQDDVIKIMEVRDVSGTKFPLNDPDHPFSMFTPKPNTLQITRPQAGVALSVVYQARHPLITEEIEGAEIEIPFTLEGALKAYIGHLVYSHMNGQENLLKSQDFEAKYEKICLDVGAGDLVSQSLSNTNTRFDQRGFK